MGILLIGNGFDLAHKLPTTYKDFLDFSTRLMLIYTLSEETTLKEYSEKAKGINPKLQIV